MWFGVAVVVLMTLVYRRGLTSHPAAETAGAIRSCFSMPDYDTDNAIVFMRASVCVSFLLIF